MRRRINLPGQLPLNFEASYLTWIDSRGEHFDTFQETTQKLLAPPSQEQVTSPIWQEIVYALKH